MNYLPDVTTILVFTDARAHACGCVCLITDFRMFACPVDAFRLPERQVSKPLRLCVVIQFIDDLYL